MKITVVMHKDPLIFLEGIMSVLDDLTTQVVKNTTSEGNAVIFIQNGGLSQADAGQIVNLTQQLATSQAALDAALAAAQNPPAPPTPTPTPTPGPGVAKPAVATPHPSTPPNPFKGH